MTRTSTRLLCVACGLALLTNSAWAQKPQKPPKKSPIKKKIKVVQGQPGKAALQGKVRLKIETKVEAKAGKKPGGKKPGGKKPGGKKPGGKKPGGKKPGVKKPGGKSGILLKRKTAVGRQKSIIIRLETQKKSTQPGKAGQQQRRVILLGKKGAVYENKKAGGKFIGKRAGFWIGVQLAPVSPALQAHLGLKPGQGLMVNQAFAKSPATAAGIKKYDILLSVNGAAVTSHEGLIQAVAAVAAAGKAKKGIKVWLFRGGKKIAVEVTPAQQATAVAYRIEKGDAAKWQRKPNYEGNLQGLDGISNLPPEIRKLIEDVLEKELKGAAIHGFRIESGKQPAVRRIRIKSSKSGQGGQPQIRIRKLEKRGSGKPQIEVQVEAILIGPDGKLQRIGSEPADFKRLRQTEVEAKLNGVLKQLKALQKAVEQLKKKK